MSRNNLDENIQGVTAGMILGVVVSGFLYAVMNDLHIWDIIYKYQTLTGSLIALLAALITVLFINKQTKLFKHQEAERLRRSLEKVRATLPFALSQLTKYSHNCIKQAIKMAKGEDFVPTAYHIETEYIRTIQNCVEYADDKTQHKLRKLLEELQIQQSRYSESIREYNLATSHSPQNHEMEPLGGTLYSCLLIDMILDELWSFARNQTRPLRFETRADRIETRMLFLSSKGRSGLVDFEAEDWRAFIDHFKRTSDKD